MLENHHLYTAFKLLKKVYSFSMVPTPPGLLSSDDMPHPQQEDQNILKNLQAEEFRLVRGLVIDMVLATDMSLHFEQLQQMKQLLSGPDV